AAARRRRRRPRQFRRPRTATLAEMRIGGVKVTSPSKPLGFYGMKEVMTRDEIMAKLKEREADLRAHGVTHAALFGSVARNEQGAESDIDILVDLDPAVVATIFDYADLKDYVASLFRGSVDVIDREALKPRFRSRATADAIYAF